MRGSAVASWLVRVLVGLAVVGAAVVAALVVGPSSLEPALVLALLVLLVLLVARRQPAAEPGTAAPGADPSVAQLTTTSIDGLDQVEHRRLEVGHPWPQLVVGPSGVSVVTPSALWGTLQVTPTGTVRGTGDHRTCTREDAALDVAVAASALLGETSTTQQVPVRVLIATASEPVVRRDPAAPVQVEVVAADRLTDALVRGPVLPMTVVDEAFSRLLVLSGGDPREVRVPGSARPSGDGLSRRRRRARGRAD